MNRNLKAFLALVLACSMMPAQAQTSATSGTAKEHKAVSRKAHVKQPTVEEQIQELRGEFQQEIDQLKQQLADRDAKLQQAEQAAQAAQSQAAEASTKAESVSSTVSQDSQAVSSLQSAVSDLKTNNTNLVQTIQNSQQEIKKAIENPTALRYKGVTITPVGFLAAETVWRQRALNSDINTPFNTTPFANAGQYYTSEFNFSGRQSRIGALVEGKTSFGKIGGYYEADFLSAGVTSNDNESNSYTLRQRQMWAQAALNTGTTVTGGQMWSLVTETKKGTDNRTENLPQTIDAQYHVGFSWARQYGLRVQQAMNHNKVTLAASMEAAQTLFSATNAPSNFFFGNAGAGGGLYNPTTNYSNNVSPDFVVKAAFDPGFGHYEIGGVGRFFRDRYYPNASTSSSAGASNNTKAAGGIFANARIPATKNFDLGLHVLTGTGVGRYGTVTLPDVTVHPDGTLEPLRATQALASIEFHNAKWNIYAYGGGEYVQRTYYTASNGKQVGYAPPSINTSGCYTEGLPASGSGYAPAGSCGAATRGVYEGTVGYWYNFYSGPKGQLKYGLQYSYLARQSWAGTAGSPDTNNNMLFTSFRYYLP
ncbi:MAG: hypothetical protein ACYC46_02895 [Acidobacteriaceae bacterium]